LRCVSFACHSVQQRKDEIGFLARALRVFRDNASEEQQCASPRKAPSRQSHKSEFLANMI